MTPTIATHGPVTPYAAAPAGAVGGLNMSFGR